MTEASDLLEQARERSKSKFPICIINTLLKSNPEVQELLDNTGRNEDNEPRGEGFLYSVAAEVINETYGLKLDYQPVSRHIRGKCGCGK